MDVISCSVLACLGCEQQLRIPNDKGELTLTCPKCRSRYEYSPAVLRPKLYSIAFFEIVGLPVVEANTQLALAYFRCVSHYQASYESSTHKKQTIADCAFDFVRHFQIYGNLTDCGIPDLDASTCALLAEVLRHGPDAVYARLEYDYARRLRTGGPKEHGTAPPKRSSWDGQWDDVVRAWEE